MFRYAMIKFLLLLNLIFFREAVALSCSLDWSLSVLSLANVLSKALANVLFMILSISFCQSRPEQPGLLSQFLHAINRLSSNLMSPLRFKSTRLRFNCLRGSILVWSTYLISFSRHKSAKIGFTLLLSSSCAPFRPTNPEIVTSIFSFCIDMASKTISCVSMTSY